MFIAVYEFEIRDGMEEEFRSYWLKATRGIYQECGSYGSRLHKSQKQNIFVGYAQWPSKKQWGMFELKKHINVEALSRMMNCLISSKTVYEMEVTDDYLHSDVLQAEQKVEHS
jgi:hypothetical protein